MIIKIRDFRIPSVQGIGFIGDGEHTTHIKRVPTKVYLVWLGMFQRCYNKRHQKIYPSYKGCTVDEIWHNFQVFAEWFTDNYIEGFVLDKDILVKGNKIYSPETCCFVPQEINQMLVKRNKSRGKYPLGVYKNKDSNKFVALVSIGKSRQKHLGIFNTPEEAFKAYKKAKEDLIKDLANKWKEIIKETVYKAVYNWIVEIGD